jgi:U3 small nucleolar RNA-associated protein 14
LNFQGWGSWAGAGLEKKVEKLMKRKQEKLLEKKKKIQEKLRARREDKNLPHVIINHKRDRKVRN